MLNKYVFFVRNPYCSDTFSDIKSAPVERSNFIYSLVRGRLILCFWGRGGVFSVFSWRETRGCCVSGRAIVQRNCWMKYGLAVSNTKASCFRANQSSALSLALVCTPPVYVDKSAICHLCYYQWHATSCCTACMMYNMWSKTYCNSVCKAAIHK